MTHIRTQVVFGRQTGDDADNQTNTWHFETDDLTSKAQEGADINGLLATFYQTIDHLMTDEFFTPTAFVKCYDLADPEPRIPFHEGTITLTLGALTQTLPAEVSLVLSYHGTFASGQNRARRRGRIYLPTFAGAILNQANMEWGATTISAVTNAATALMNNSVSGLNWAVYSPTTRNQGGSLDDAFDDVVGGWVDTDPDIQRRRGPDAPRFKQVWPVV